MAGTINITEILDTLQLQLLTLVDDISDEIDKIEATMLVYQYIMVSKAVLSLSSKTMSSYSIAGRSVTSLDLPNLRIQLRGIKEELGQYIDLPDTNRNTVAHADMSTMAY